MSAAEDLDNSQKDGKPMETSQQTRRQSASMWLAAQNEELRDKIKKLEIEVYHWKLYANDFSGRLQRLQQDSGKQNYVNTFYDASIKTFMKSISEENIVLKNELNIKDYSASNGTKRIHDLRNLNRELQEQLEIRSAENRILKKQIENMQCPDAINELKNSFLKLEKDYLKITVDNTNLKNHARNKDDIMNYLEIWFDKQRKEFIKIFTDHYLELGEEFIKQLKSLDPAVPEFLSKPLTRSISTNTDNDNILDALNIPTENKTTDPYKDSGIDTLPDEFRELMSASQELEEAKETIKYLNEKLKDGNKQTDLNNLLKTNAELVEAVRSLESRIRMKDDGLRKQAKQLSESRNDGLCWKAAYDQLSKECRQTEDDKYTLERRCKFLEERNLAGAAHWQNYPSESSTSLHYDQGKRLARAGLTEPFQNVNWRSNMPLSILVRDGPTKSENQSPRENRNQSNYLPRGPVSRNEPIEDDTSVCSKDIHEQKESSEMDTSSDGTSGCYPSTKCRYCQKDVTNEEYNSHMACCQRSDRT